MSLIIATDFASILYRSRQYENSLKQCESVLALDPGFYHARDEMIPAYLQLGRYDKAMEGINLLAEHGQESWALAWKAAVYSRAGYAQKARQALAKLEQSSGSRADRTATLLLAYSGTGEKERLIELLQKAYSEHSNAIVKMKVDPIFDPFRSDPRFEDLLRQLGLGPSENVSTN